MRKKLIVIGLLLIAFKLGMNYEKRNITNKQTGQAKQTEQSIDVEKLKAEVLPPGGFTVRLPWKDMGQKLVAAGVIDRKKFDPLFPEQKELFKYLETGDSQEIVINERTAQFWVDLLWAVGLANKSTVLDEGPMKEGGNPANFASTGGWTLGKKETMTYYSKLRLIPLTEAQQQQVRLIAENVYRPCCGNSTAFPDCNHGMAALAIIEMMVADGKTESEIYQTILKFNTYWFPQTYREVAYHFAKNGTPWKKVDPKLALSKSFSSAMGSQAVRKQLGSVPGLIESGGGGCGV